MIGLSILTSVHPPFDIRIFHKEAKSLVRAGYDVTLIAQHEREEIVDGVRIVPLQKPKNRLHRMTTTVWQAYKVARHINADIYHFHDPELILVSLLLKWHGKTVIYDVHEDVPRANLSKFYIPKYLRKPLSSIIEVIEDFSAKRFDGIITATSFINERFLKLRANTVNVNNYPIVSELYANENDWKKKGKEVCYVGGIARMRGAFEMVEAIRQTDYRLILAGDFDPDPDLIDELKKLPGWKNVNVLGFVDRGGVRDVMARSMAGLVIFHPEPNHINAQPNKLFEYMSAGLPVVASHFPSWREIVEKNNCGVCVDPLNHQEIANAIRWIIDNPAKAKKMGENGRRAVEQRYNWGVEEKKLLGLYSGIIASRKSAKMP